MRQQRQKQATGSSSSSSSSSKSYSNTKTTVVTLTAPKSVSSGGRSGCMSSNIASTTSRSRNQNNGKERAEVVVYGEYVPRDGRRVSAEAVDREQQEGRDQKGQEQEHQHKEQQRDQQYLPTLIVSAASIVRELQQQEEQQQQEEAGHQHHQQHQKIKHNRSQRQAPWESWKGTSRTVADMGGRIDTILENINETTKMSKNNRNTHRLLEEDGQGEQEPEETREVASSSSYSEGRGDEGEEREGYADRDEGGEAEEVQDHDEHYHQTFTEQDQELDLNDAVGGGGDGVLVLNVDNDDFATDRDKIRFLLLEDLSQRCGSRDSDGVAHILCQLSNLCYYDENNNDSSGAGVNNNENDDDEGAGNNGNASSSWYTYDEEHARWIGELDGGTLVLFVLRQYPHHVEIQSQGCRFFMNWMRGDIGRDRVETLGCRLGCIRFIIRALNFFPHECDVQLHSMGAMVNFAENGSSSLREIVYADGTPAVVMAMLRHPDDALLQRWACLILSRVCREKEYRPLVKLAGAFREVAAAIDNHGADDEELHFYASNVIEWLVKKDW